VALLLERTSSILNGILHSCKCRGESPATLGNSTITGRLAIGFSGSWREVSPLCFSTRLLDSHANERKFSPLVCVIAGLADYALRYNMRMKHPAQHQGHLLRAGFVPRQTDILVAMRKLPPKPTVRQIVQQLQAQAGGLMFISPAFVNALRILENCGLIQIPNNRPRENRDQLRILLESFRFFLYHKTSLGKISTELRQELEDEATRELISMQMQKKRGRPAKAVSHTVLYRATQQQRERGKTKDRALEIVRRKFKDPRAYRTREKATAKGKKIIQQLQPELNRAVMEYPARRRDHNPRN
jgi:hypothetical protein